MEETDPFDILFVDEKTATEELQKRVEQASEIFVIERETGKILFKNYESLNDSQRVMVVLLGRYIAKKKGLNVSDCLGPSELGQNIGKSRTSISAPLAKLRTMGIIEAVDGSYRINPHRVGKILDFITTR